MVTPTGGRIPVALVVWGQSFVAIVLANEPQMVGMRCQMVVWAIPGMRCRTTVWAILLQFQRWRYRHGSLGLVYGSLSERRIDLRRSEFYQLCLCLNFLTGLRRKQGQMQQALACNVMQKVHVDLVGPFPTSKRRYKYLLTAICGFTKYLVCVPIRDKVSVTVANALMKHLYLV